MTDDLYSGAESVPWETEFPWSENARKLKTWFVAYLLTLSAGFSLVISRSFDGAVGILLIFGSLVPYIVAIVFSYRVQTELNRAKLYKPGAWQIILGALLFNPFILGFVIPASVLWVTRRIEKQIREGKVDYYALPHPAS